MHKARKRFGQNFLRDNNVVANIVSSIAPQKNDIMIEIGPGLGAMTIPLLDSLQTLYVIELDRDIIPRLIDNCRRQDADLVDRLVINETDVLKFDFADFHDKHACGKKLRVVGNLPYNISTPVLFHLLHYRQLIKDMHFMLQKEVVDRIVSSPRNKHYGRLSVMLQTFCDVESLFEVPPHAFEPAPKVDSAILRLQVSHRYEDQISDFSSYEQLVRQAFSQRRKTLRNTLKSLCTEKDFEKASISAGQRAEELTVADFVRLYNVLD